MTTPVQPNASAWHVGDRVEVHDQGRYTAARISSIHRIGDRIEYVVHTDPEDGGIGGIVNIDAATGRLRARRDAA